MPASALPDGELAFTYFPGNYRWSHGVLIALGGAPWGGAEIDEVHRIGLRLKDRDGDDVAWFDEWAGEAERIEAIGHAEAAKGHALTAASYLFRAAHYYHVGERFTQPKTGASQAAYMRGVQAFRKAAGLVTRPRIEHVEVPYEGASLPGVIVHADPVAGRRGKGPVMLFLDGFDVTKEIQYFRGIPDLAARGVSCLILDGPGNGEAIRFRHLPLHHETERHAGAAYDFLAARPEFDPKRVGIMALSLGGYYAPRAAAFEKRVKACIGLSGPYDMGSAWDGLPELTRETFRTRAHCKTQDEARQVAATLSLAGVAQKITCPLYIVTGKLDRVVPWQDAERLAREAKGAVELVIIEDGNHVANNRVYKYRSQSADWMAQQLEPVSLISTRGY